MSWQAGTKHFQHRHPPLFSPTTWLSPTSTAAQEAPTLSGFQTGGWDERYRDHQPAQPAGVTNWVVVTNLIGAPAAFSAQLQVLPPNSAPLLQPISDVTMDELTLPQVQRARQRH